MILVTGRGTSGSFNIRGRQLGAAIGATVDTKPKPCDLAIVVKRWTFVPTVPIVYDVVDGWPQPVGNEWPREQCMQWLRSQVSALRPVGIVAATEAMARDCAEFNRPVLCLPHHARPGQAINPIRKRITKVGYSGAEHYLGRWRAILEGECKKRGWAFVCNPTELAELDIVVALRDARGYAARNWKSNCKLGNAQGSGTPCILSHESGYVETASGAERWAESRDGLVRAFDELEPLETRRSISKTLLQAAPQLQAIASRYREWLKQWA